MARDGRRIGEGTVSRFLPPDGIFGSGYRTKANPCLSCGKTIDAGSAIGTDQAPRPGAICVCAYCGHPQAWTDGLIFRELQQAELDMLRTLPEWKVVEVVQQRARERK
jgi:hypothetical protein